jgi:hypothetical protein
MQTFMIVALIVIAFIIAAILEGDDPGQRDDYDNQRFDKC